MTDTPKTQKEAVLPPLESCPEELKHGYPDCDCDLEGGDDGCTKKPTVAELYERYGPLKQRERQLTEALTKLAARDDDREFLLSLLPPLDGVERDGIRLNRRGDCDLGLRMALKIRAVSDSIIKRVEGLAALPVATEGEKEPIWVGSPEWVRREEEKRMNEGVRKLQELSITQAMRGRPVTHEEAAASAQRLVNSHFGNPDGARMQIPANPADDDLIVSDYIREQAAKAEATRVTQPKVDGGGVCPQCGEFPYDCTGHAPDAEAVRILRAIVADDSFAEPCQGIGEEPQWLKDARAYFPTQEGPK